MPYTTTMLQSKDFYFISITTFQVLIALGNTSLALFPFFIGKQANNKS